jgi:hypothetical protein
METVGRDTNKRSVVVFAFTRLRVFERGIMMSLLMSAMVLFAGCSASDTPLQSGETFLADSLEVTGQDASPPTERPDEEISTEDAAPEAGDAREEDSTQQTATKTETPNFTIGEILFQGVDACNSKKVTVDVQRESNGFFVDCDYDSLTHRMVEAGQTKTAACNIAIPIEVSAGYTLSLSGATVEGAASVPNDARAAISTRMQLNAEPQIKAFHRVEGPFQGDVSFPVSLDEEAVVPDEEPTPPCRNMHVLNINSRLYVNDLETMAQIKSVKTSFVSLVPCKPEQE